MPFQSLNRAYKRSDARLRIRIILTACSFQSLNRAYKRSDKPVEDTFNWQSIVSIPQSGLQAFRRPLRSRFWRSFDRFNPSIGLTSVPTRLPGDDALVCSDVSIPQSGLQAFRLLLPSLPGVLQARFNPSIGLTSVPTFSSSSGMILSGAVSIPQSGLQAFRRYLAPALPDIPYVSIPQSGLQAFRP